MQSSSKEIRRKIRSKKAEIHRIKSSYNEKITQLKDKERTLRDKVYFKERMSLISGGASGEEQKRLEDVRNELVKVKSEKEKKLAAAEAELDKLQDDYRDNFDKYQKADKKKLENKITDAKNTIKRNKTAIVIGSTVVGALLLFFLVNTIINAIAVAGEESKNFFININDQFTFDCNVTVDNRYANSTKCAEREISGEFSNYTSVIFAYSYYPGSGAYNDTSVTTNGNNFTKKLNDELVTRTLWETDEFDYSALGSGIDREYRLELFNTKLNRAVASKVVKVHYNFTEADKNIISDNHSGWVEWKKAEEERKVAEEAKKQAEKEEANRKAAEEAAKKKAEEEAKKQAEEEAARKKAEEEAAKKEASTIYKWKTIKDGETCPSNARLCVVYDGGSGYAKYGYGTIKGRVLNNSGRDASYMQISMSVYNASGVKIGDCYDNVSGLGSGKTWAFEAYCTGWSEGVTSGDLDIAWW